MSDLGSLSFCVARYMIFLKLQPIKITHIVILEMLWCLAKLENEWLRCGWGTRGWKHHKNKYAPATWGKLPIKWSLKCTYYDFLLQFISVVRKLGMKVSIFFGLNRVSCIVCYLKWTVECLMPMNFLYIDFLKQFGNNVFVSCVTCT